MGDLQGGVLPQVQEDDEEKLNLMKNKKVNTHK